MVSCQVRHLRATLGNYLNEFREMQGVRGEGRVTIVPLQPPWEHVHGLDRTVESILPPDFAFNTSIPGYMVEFHRPQTTFLDSDDSSDDDDDMVGTDDDGMADTVLPIETSPEFVGSSPSTEF